MRSDKHKTKEISKLKWGALGFFLPFVGVVLLIAWRNKKPITARNIGIGTITSFSLLMVAGIIFLMVLPKNGPSTAAINESSFLDENSVVSSSTASSSFESESSSSSSSVPEGSTSTTTSSSVKIIDSSDAVNTRNLTTQQVKDWVDIVLQKRAEGDQWSFLKNKTYTSTISMGNDGLVYIEVEEASQNFTTSFRINAQGQLEETNTDRTAYAVVSDKFGEAG